MQQPTANSSQQFAPRVPGPAFTPNQSFTGSAQPPDQQRLDWVDKQAKEHEGAKNRLSDHKFNIRDYPDPLLPRQHSPSHYYPKGVTAEMERHLQDTILKIKAGNP
ncbi:hypothetical protein SAMD00023353_0802860 [Rosellinia necatrix]|uniref:Uncharacterized protein n=1 Tax=Rosellinia necatrix TaxID=77044 RepID=A0A1S8A6A3_ROSNE|nr:hypothetical protein SAMD00023353_0802860 [Rosellinia necatrix]